MEFRLWLEAVEKKIIVDLKSNRLPGHGNWTQKTFEYTVYKNPSKEELMKSFESEKEMSIFYFGKESIYGTSVRGILTTDNNIYIWPETASTHEEMRHELSSQIDLKVAFYINSRELQITSWMGKEAIKEVEENINYRKMIGLPLVVHSARDWQYTGPTWDTALQPKKVKPGGLEKLPYEWIESENQIRLMRPV